MRIMKESLFVFVYQSFLNLDFRFCFSFVRTKLRLFAPEDRYIPARIALYVLSFFSCLAFGHTWSPSFIILLYYKRKRISYKQRFFHPMYHYAFLSPKANIISTSQATSPSTVAIPFPFPTAPRKRTISTSRRSWSPGTT